MTTALAYGQGKLRVEFEGLDVEVIQPDHRPGIADERAALIEALDNPIGAEPLSRWMKPDQRICVTFTDLTRATPNERIIPVLLDYLERHGAREGHHRPPEPARDASSEHQGRARVDAHPRGRPVVSRVEP